MGRQAGFTHSKSKSGSQFELIVKTLRMLCAFSLSKMVCVARYGKTHAFKRWRRIIKVCPQQFIILQLSMRANFVAERNNVIGLRRFFEPFLELLRNKATVKQYGELCLKHKKLEPADPNGT